MGPSEWRGLGDAFDLTAIGCNLEVIKPGGSSGLKHWHTDSEEFVYVLSGRLILQYGADTFELSQGMCIGFKANEGLGHRLLNRTDADASFIVVGTRTAADKAVYDEDDFKWLVEEDGAWIAARKNGEPY